MMRALLDRELRLAWRSGAEILNPLWFFLIVITLFPFGVGAAPQLLAQIAPGVVWVAALKALLLNGRPIVEDDAIPGLDLDAMRHDALAAVRTLQQRAAV
ncbi:hypothetical protein BME65_10010 [Klebsiella pneumoniae]|nr:heme exporter protein CcmB [Klebsiella pneumoniae]OVV77444.1 hypothetical protein BME65_10010 [Klebsiella pneumoniae]